MTSRPIVEAEYVHEMREVLTYQGDTFSTAPGIEVRVRFRLHDHEAALAALERAVKDVRAQIGETA